MAIETSIDRSSAAAPPRTQDAQDLLGRVGRRGDRVGAEDREGLLLARRSSISVGRERPAEDHPAGTGPAPARARARHRGRLARDELVGTGVAEVRGVGRSTRTRRSPAFRPVSGRRPPDHARGAIMRATGRCALSDADRRRPARACGTTIRCHNATSIDNQHRRCATDDEDARDLLGRIGGRGDSVGAEIGERLLLVEALLEVMPRSTRGRPNTTPRNRASRTAGARARDRRGFPRDELAGTGIPEIRRVEDARRGYACRPPFARSEGVDHAVRSRGGRRGTRRRALDDADRRRPALVCGMSIRCHAGRPARPARPSRGPAVARRCGLNNVADQVDAAVRDLGYEDVRTAQQRLADFRRPLSLYRNRSDRSCAAGTRAGAR